ncbi:hypothetical protein VYU27_010313, partial [Nannochloropsis oceanica]
WTSNGHGSSAWPALLQTLQGLYTPFRTASLDASLVDAWNEQRKEILSTALHSHLLPELEAEVKREMRKKAEEAVVSMAADALREVVNTGTYLPKCRNINCTLIPPYEDFQLRPSQKFPFELTPLSSSSLDVVAVLQAPSRSEPSFAVSVGRDGAVRDFVMLPPLQSGYDGDAAQTVYVESNPASDLTTPVAAFVVTQVEGITLAQATAKLAEFEFPEDLQMAPLSSLSGGWRMKLALAQAMLQDPDMLLLDEPTNHLDTNAVAWLKLYLKSLKHVTCLMVSHSTSFLDDVCTDIIHYEEQKLVPYVGNLSAFVAKHPPVPVH